MRNPKIRGNKSREKTLGNAGDTVVVQLCAVETVAMESRGHEKR